jgi:hypothetical protein
MEPIVGVGGVVSTATLFIVPVNIEAQITIHFALAFIVFIIISPV